MNALILAAGLGTRLQGIAPETPKPMMEVRGTPLLEIIVQKLFKVGVSKILINVHHLPEKITSYILNQSYSDKIEIVRETKLLGTAGTLKNNIQQLISDDFFVLHGDNYFQDDLREILRKHKKSGSEVLVSMGTFITTDRASTGTVITNGDSIIQKFYEKNPESPSFQANSAIFIMKPTIVSEIEGLSPLESDISRDLLPKILGRIQAIPLEGYFFDIGTPENYAKANGLEIG